MSGSVGCCWGRKPMELGRGGIKAVAEATGVHPDTIAHGAREVAGQPEPQRRVRAGGGARSWPGERRHRSRHLRFRPADLMGHHRQSPLPRGEPAADLRRRRRLQRLPGPRLEDRAREARHRDRPGDHRLPPAAGHQQVEQNRAPAVSQITLNWRGLPLTSHQVIVDLISNTTTATGLTVRCVLHTGAYPTGVRYTKKDIDTLPITYHDFQGAWNYTVRQADTPRPPCTTPRNCAAAAAWTTSARSSPA